MHTSSLAADALSLLYYKSVPFVAVLAAIHQLIRPPYVTIVAYKSSSTYTWLAKCLESCDRYKPCKIASTRATARSFSSLVAAPSSIPYMDYTQAPPLDPSSLSPEPMRFESLVSNPPKTVQRAMNSRRENSTHKRIVAARLVLYGFELAKKKHSPKSLGAEIRDRDRVVRSSRMSLTRTPTHTSIIQGVLLR